MLIVSMMLVQIGGRLSAQEAGMLTQVCNRAQHALRFLKHNFANLMLLDVNLPDQSGFSLLEELKSNDIIIPTIFLTGNTLEVNKVKGLELGGDDYITGNGNTRLQYTNALAAVTVDITSGLAYGTAAGDVAGVGTDHFTGVNAAMGSMFDDTLLGGAGNEQFTGLAGNDFINGNGGFDTAVYNNLTYTTAGINVDMTAGVVTGDASVGTDTLRSI